MKPRVFIASSVEGLDVAYALQENLEHDIEATVWRQGVFSPGDFVLPRLLRSLDDYDFGIFVFTPDDLVRIRGVEESSVRDNVLFELGVFIGRFGVDRNFIVRPRTAELPRIPADLTGIIYADYEAGRQDGNLQAAAGPASNTIRRRIISLGRRGASMTQDGSLVSVNVSASTSGKQEDRGTEIATEQSEYALRRMREELQSPRYVWRSIERLAIVAGVSEEQALDLLRTDADVVLGEGRLGQLARLRTRQPLEHM
jgi:hypothetical protein